MQLIENGPDVPERLLQAHEEGRVVFFCGAGISYPAGLPGFGGLVTRVRDELGLAFSSPVSAAFKRGQYDSVLGLLEGELVNGREVIRRQVASVLTANLALPDATATHEALLTLSRTRDQRQRLITTNFDRLFEEVRTAKQLSFHSYMAPLLPVPKKRWDGVVYLHGLLSAAPTASNLNSLVLSSGDFGLAYLTERWAARFVGELFRSMTVCFVGYSINDPVLRYMMDALAADRLLGESPPEVFAFGSYNKVENGRESAAAEWRAKNVTPILYREYKHHHYLHRTLREWAKIYRDGVEGHESIVARHARSQPGGSTAEDDYVGRLFWALSHCSGLPAKRFAEFDPLPSLDWLEPMSKTQYGYSDLERFGVRANLQPDDKLSFSLIVRPSPYALGPRMRLVGHHGLREGKLDAVMLWLAHWLARHVGDPALVLWVAGHGPRLHDAFAWHVEKALKEPGVPAAMVRLWRIVLSGRLHDMTRHFDLYSWVERLRANGYSPGLRLELVSLLVPQVQLSRSMRMDGDEGHREPNAEARIRDLVNWEIVLRSDYARDALRPLDDNAAWRRVLTECLADFTNLLRDALDLMRELDGAGDRSDFSYVAHPSIEPHEQNRDFNEWTVLIDLVRDAWAETAQTAPELARAEVKRWLSLRYPLFRRLAFFAAKNRGVFSATFGLDVLLDDPWWLWSTETQREAIRLLVSVAPDLDEGDALRLQNVVLAGPDRAMFREHAEAEQIDRAIDREIWLRLIRLRDAGAQLAEAATARLADIEQRYPRWQPAAGDRDDFAFWIGDGGGWGEFRRTPVGLRELIDWLRDNPEARNFDSDDWQERCQKDSLRATQALFTLARQGIWPAARWRTALQAWAEPALLAQSWQRLATLLANAPDQFLRDANHATSWWLQAQAKTFSRREREFLTLVDRMLRLHRDDDLEIRDDIVGQSINHPIGHAMQALFSWWYRQNLRDGQGLHADVSRMLTEVSDTASTSYRLGRVLFGPNLIALFRVDHGWTQRHVLPLLDWARSVEEASAIWKGFLWNPRLYRSLFAEFKPMFLATAARAQVLGEHGEQYAGILTYAGLEATDLFTRAEMTGALTVLGERGLSRAARTLLDALEGSGEQRSAYWENRIKPFIERHWPRAAALRTPAISEKFARLCVASGGSFPEAFARLHDWLMPSERHDMLSQKLFESGLCQTHPETALQLLSVVIGDNPQWPPHQLRECLDQIQLADDALLRDHRFQRLDQLLRRHAR
ncbi:MAG: anti-phage defense-associated sirtuin Dsr1 [Hyphomicrobiaceae bacterium]|nr:anti-phage defense-associated sirtuin Dsr1 [Hyphomicrobiaceae bacterium]